MLKKNKVLVVLIALLLVSVGVSLNVSFANEEVHKFIEVMEPGEYYNTTEEMVNILGEPSKVVEVEHIGNNLITRHYFESRGLIVDSINDMPYKMEVWSDDEFEGFSKNIGTFNDVMKTHGIPNNTFNNGEYSSVTYESKLYNFLSYRLTSTGTELESEIYTMSIIILPLENYIEELRESQVSLENEEEINDSTSSDNEVTKNNDDGIDISVSESLGYTIYTLKMEEGFFPLMADENIFVQKIIKETSDFHQLDTITIHNDSNYTYNDFEIAYIFYDAYGYPVETSIKSLPELKPNATVQVEFECYNNGISKSEFYNISFTSKK